MTEDEGPSAEQMAPHTRQRDPQVRERAGLMGKPDKSGGSWMDGMGEGGIAT